MKKSPLAIVKGNAMEVIKLKAYDSQLLRNLGVLIHHRFFLKKGIYVGI